MTFAEWQRGRRLAEAFTQIRSGAPLDDVVFANGYESHSGFRDAFTKTFGDAPMRARDREFIAAQFIESPLGPLLAAATRDACGGNCKTYRTAKRFRTRSSRAPSVNLPLCAPLRARTVPIALAF